MRLALAALATTAALAGCGGSSTGAPPPPRLPHALAHEWATRADSIASAISAGDGCSAQQLAQTLRDDVIGSESHVPLRYRAILLGAVNQLADGISCTRTVTVPAPKHGPKPKPPKHGHHGHGDEG